jgi:hypothetical protein
MVEPVITPTKDETITEKPVEKKPGTKIELKTDYASGAVIFKVQISATGKRLETIPSNFKGLSNVSVSNENGTLYKYFTGKPQIIIPPNAISRKRALKVFRRLTSLPIRMVKGFLTGSA